MMNFIEWMQQYEASGFPKEQDVERPDRSNLLKRKVDTRRAGMETLKRSRWQNDPEVKLSTGLGSRLPKK